MASPETIERIARHLFNLTPAKSDSNAAMEFSRKHAREICERFEVAARSLCQPHLAPDFKTRATGETE